jgi:hypothetical protein
MSRKLKGAIQRPNNEMQRTSHGTNGGSPLISVLDRQCRNERGQVEGSRNGRGVADLRRLGTVCARARRWLLHRLGRHASELGRHRSNGWHALPGRRRHRRSWSTLVACGATDHRPRHPSRVPNRGLRDNHHPSHRSSGCTSGPDLESRTSPSSDWQGLTDCASELPAAYGRWVSSERSNKRMQLTKLRAAPVLQAEVPPCAPAGETDGGAASQLIRSVRQTRSRRDSRARVC